jgi:hypothetical protein
MMDWLRQPVSWGLWLFTVLLLGGVFALMIWYGAELRIDAHDAKLSAIRQKEGRAVAIDVLCGFGNGVAEAGRKALAGELIGQSAARGLPVESQRDYVGTITSTLLAEAGINARDVIRPDGQVDCEKLRAAAKAPRP